MCNDGGSVVGTRKHDGSISPSDENSTPSPVYIFSTLESSLFLRQIMFSDMIQRSGTQTVKPRTY